MSERYTSVFSLPPDLYATGSPVVISAGSLLKDSQTGAILAQLKLRNISSKTIIGVRVRLRLFDAFSAVIGEPVAYEYLDLHAGRDAEFGQKEPIFIPENKARLYKATVTSVVFEDRSIWMANDERWTPLTKPNRLMFHDPELRRQYELRFGRSFGYQPREERDLWYCTCGALNHTGENCHICRHNPNAFNMEELVAQKNVRLAREAAMRAEERAAREAAAEAERLRKEAAAAAAREKKEAAEAAAREKKEAAAAAAREKKEAAAAEAARKKEEAAAAAARKEEAAQQKKEAAAQKKKEKAEAAARKKEAAKQKRKQTGILPVVCIAAVLVPLLLWFGIPAARYSRALYFMHTERYEEAIAAFEALEGYGDSEVRIDICLENIRENTYLEGCSLMAQGSYPDAYYLFRDLGDYKDCQARIAICENASEEVTYQVALKLMESKEWEAARDKLRKIPRYQDSLSLMRACTLELGQIKVEEALKWIEDLQYVRALDAFLAAEAYGLDCRDQIKECEINILSNPNFKRYARIKPVVTHGAPNGKERKIYGFAEGNVRVHSITRVDLDNGCVRFTIDCTPPKCEFISFFNPPSGSIFMFYEETDPAPKRQTLVFDVLKQDAKDSREITLRFGNSGGWIFIRNL